jgi:hypothetical protein
MAMIKVVVAYSIKKGVHAWQVVIKQIITEGCWYSFIEQKEIGFGS